MTPSRIVALLLVRSTFLGSNGRPTLLVSVGLLVECITPNRNETTLDVIRAWRIAGPTPSQLPGRICETADWYIQVPVLLGDDNTGFVEQDSAPSASRALQKPPMASIIAPYRASAHSRRLVQSSPVFGTLERLASSHVDIVVQRAPAV